MHGTAAAVALATGLVLGACSTTVVGQAAPVAAALAPPQPAGEAFTDGTGRFRLVPPPGWTVDTTGTQGTAVRFVDPAAVTSTKKAFTANINVLVVRAGVDLPVTVVGARKELTGLTGYRSTTDEPVTLQGGRPAHLLGGTFTDRKSGFELRNLQLFAVEKGTTFVVNGTAPALTWSTYAPMFDGALRSLTVSP